MPKAPAPDTLRVLHLGKYYPPAYGGMETYLRDLCIALQRTGTRCLALVHAQGRSWRSTIDDAADDRPIVVRAATWARPLYTPVSPGLPLLLHRHIHRFEPDILHLHLPNPSALAVLALPAARRLPWVIHWHADIIAAPEQRRLALAYGLYRHGERALLARARAIIATSTEYLNSSAALQAFRPGCRVIPLGRDMPARWQHNTVSITDTAPLRLIAAGRLALYKGFDVLLHALAQVPGVVLTIVGDGEARSALIQLVEKLQLADRVTMRGAIDDAELATCLDTSDCLVLPSIARTEAFGLVLLEAMAAGIATIASAVPGSGILEVVDDGVTGLLVPPADPLALAGAIRRLRDNRSLAHSLGRSGSRRFAAHYQISTSVHAIRALYTHVLET